MATKTHLSIIVPTLNEERYVSQTIRDLTQGLDRFDYEIMIVDGGSRDRTIEIVKSLAEEDSRIKLIHNEKRIQSAAFNLAAQLADSRSDVLIRADCHAQYPDHFVAVVYDALQESGASSVVVPMLTVGTSCRQTAIAAAQNSRLGNGGSPHRLGQRSLWVEHGHHAAFRRNVFTAVGGYDETFTHNEDAEFDIRNTKAGGRIWMEAKACLKYFPRESFTKLAKQYFKYGAGRAKTYRKHNQVPSFRQLIPAIVFVACLLSLVLAPFFPYSLVVPLSYAAMCLTMGALIGMQQSSLCAAAGSGLAAIVMHMSWAVGFLLGFGGWHRKNK